MQYDAVLAWARMDADLTDPGVGIKTNENHLANEIITDSWLKMMVSSLLMGLGFGIELKMMLSSLLMMCIGFGINERTPRYVDCVHANIVYRQQKNVLYSNVPTCCAYLSRSRSIRNATSKNGISTRRHLLVW